MPLLSTPKICIKKNVSQEIDHWRHYTHYIAFYVLHRLSRYTTGVPSVFLWRGGIFFESLIPEGGTRVTRGGGVVFLETLPPRGEIPPGDIKPKRLQTTQAHTTHYRRRYNAFLQGYDTAVVATQWTRSAISSSGGKGWKAALLGGVFQAHDAPHLLQGVPLIPGRRREHTTLGM